MDEFRDASKQVERLLDSNDFDGARQLAEALVSKYPNNSFLAWRLGSILGYYIGDWPSAIPHYQRAISLDEACAPAWGGLGDAYFDLGDYENAASAFEKKISLEPTTHHYVLLSASQRALGRLPEAVESSRRAIRLDGQNSEAYLNLGIALKALGDDRGSRNAFAVAVSLDPEHNIIVEKINNK